MNTKTYFVKQSWIFNLEAMHDKLWCIIYDIRDNNIKLPVNILGKNIYSESDVDELMNECSDLEWIAKSRKVTGKEFGRIKEIVNWRVNQRYMTCLNSGMPEDIAGGCFEDI